MKVKMAIGKIGLETCLLCLEISCGIASQILEAATARNTSLSYASIANEKIQSYYKL